MRIRVSQQTVHTYDPPAKSLIQTLRLTPRNHEGQYVVHWRIDVDHDGRLRQGEDAFANITHQFSGEGPLAQVTISVEGEVETHDTTGIVRGTVERFPADLFLRDCELAAADEGVRTLASDVAAACGTDRLARLHGLMGAVHDAVTLASGDDRATSAAACLAAGAGTADGISHLFIAAARQLGIPARFVSGFMHQEPETVATGWHAWAECHVERLGWVGFDPVLNACPVESHVRVAVGLDALGAQAVRGSAWGGGPERSAMTVAVRAHARQDDPPPSQSQSQSQS